MKKKPVQPHIDCPETFITVVITGWILASIFIDFMSPWFIAVGRIALTLILIWLVWGVELLTAWVIWKHKRKEVKRYERDSF